MALTVLRWLLAGPGWIVAALSALSRRAVSHPSVMALGVALVVCGWLHRANEDSRNVIAARDAEIAALHKAGQEARALAEAQVKAVEGRYKEHADEADLSYRAGLADARSRSAAYADANSLRAAMPAGCGNPAATGEDRPSEDHHRPGDDAVVVARADFDLLAADAVRLDEVRRWGEALMRDGLAVSPSE